MAKYIDADRLRTEIEILIEKYSSVEAKGVLQEGYKGGRLIGYRDTINKLNSLHQEQPEADFDNEIEKYFKGWTETDEGIACHYQYVDLNTCYGIARHFYELGQSMMRKRFTYPEYNQRVIKKMKSEYPSNESNARKEE